MTRKGKIPITLPKGVEVNLTGMIVNVKGPKGSLQQEIKPGIIVEIEGDQVTVSQEENVKDIAKFHGLYRTLISNMVIGTSEGFKKDLEMIGVGYRANVQGKDLNLLVGFSHPTLLPIPAGLEVKIDKNTKILISGIDKQLVGQFAATIRSLRPPEPYQGKGIRYVGEYVRRKAGKAASK